VDKKRISRELAQEIQRLVQAALEGSASDEELARLDEVVCSEQAADYVASAIGTSQHLRDWSSSRQAARESAMPRPLRSPIFGFLHDAVSRTRENVGELRFKVALAAVLSLLFAGAVAGTGAILSAIIQRNAVPPQVVQNIPPPPKLQSVPGNGRDSKVGDDGHISASPVASLARTVDCVWSDQLHVPKPGDKFAAGRKLVLKSGLAEFVFEDGAEAILQGPATLEVRSRASLALNRGKLCVTVKKPSARGFAVEAPGMKYTDLGTEFGVLVAENGEQEVHVFRGKVQAETAMSHPDGTRRQGRDSNPRSPLPAPRTVLLSAHEAIRIASPDKPMEQIAADEKQFVRAILEPFAVFGTGMGLDRGARDPNWEITQISTDAKFKPQSAVVAAPDQNYAPDNRAKAQWISNSKSRDDMPVGCRWTLRSHFDLAGFDPSSARIEGQISADDFVVQIRMNGKAVRIPEGNRDAMLYRKWLPLRIDEGFVSGDNVLEIVIENGDGVSPEQRSPISSPMALCVELNGLAHKSVNLKTEKGAR
jgi:hypothetical protein